MKQRFGILLDNGHVILIGWQQEARARAAYRRWKESRREAEKTGDIVKPRQVLGFVIFGRLYRHAAAIGQAGGRARATKLSSKRRSEIARTAAKARWNRQKTQGI